MAKTISLKDNYRRAYLKAQKQGTEKGRLKAIDAIFLAEKKRRQTDPRSVAVIPLCRDQTSTVVVPLSIRTTVENFGDP
jgi:hypothetical protein